VPVQYSITTNRQLDFTDCTQSQCLYSTPNPLWTVRALQSLSACTEQLYLYSPCGPYGLYRASVPVQYSYTSTPTMDRTACTEPQCVYSTAIIPLTALAVRPLQSLSFRTVQLYIYSPKGQYGLYTASGPVKYSYTSTPLWTVRAVQSLSACT